MKRILCILVSPRFSLTFHDLLLSHFMCDTDVTLPEDTTNSQLKKLIRNCNVSVSKMSTITTKTTVSMWIWPNNIWQFSPETNSLVHLAVVSVVFYVYLQKWNLDKLSISCQRLWDDWADFIYLHQYVIFKGFSISSSFKVKFIERAGVLASVWHKKVALSQCCQLPWRLQQWEAPQEHTVCWIVSEIWQILVLPLTALVQQLMTNQ